MSPVAAERLEGQMLEGGWLVVRRLRPTEDDTGGTFSVGYEATRNGVRAFVKAIDVRGALLADGGVATTRALLGGQLVEADILERCARAGLSRVIAPLGKGVWVDPEESHAVPVPYVITEWADGGDLRQALAISSGTSVQFVLGALHGVGVGLQQVHGEGIAHLDMKPSNALLVRGNTKIGDFGHAVAEDDMSDGEHAPRGATCYAPPEILYGVEPSTAGGRRAVDIYLFGSLMAGMFMGGVPITSIWLGVLEDELQPANFSGAFDDVLPHVIEAFQSAIQFVGARVPPAVGPQYVEMVRQLSWPDPVRRGHRRELNGHQNPYALRRIITGLDLMAKRALLRSAR